VACSTCHDPAPPRSPTGGPPPSGSKGASGAHRAAILNALYTRRILDGGETLEEQRHCPIVNRVEMGQPSLDAAVARIAAIEATVSLPSRLQPPPTGPDLVRASVYERTQLSFDSPFDHFSRRQERN